jgi:peptidoglycan/LPS O-acetylase OafA/YrhL
MVGRSGAAGTLIFWASGALVAIVLTGLVSDQSSRLVRALEFPPLRYVGTISYGIYIYHSVVLLPEWPGVIPPKVKTLVEFITMLGVASLSWHLIERRLLDFRDNLRQRRLARMDTQVA